jgi:hypothetical protein
MSDTLVAFAKPLLDELPDEARAEEIEAVLLLAMAAWNAALTRQAGELETELRVLTRKISEHSEAPPAITLALLRMLAERKLSLFPHDTRGVVSVHVGGESPHFRIFATSTLLKR